MALYPFTNKETGDITLVAARSKERAAQVLAEKTFNIGDVVKGEDSARLMAKGATFIDDTDPPPADPEPGADGKKPADPAAPGESDQGDQSGKG